METIKIILIDDHKLILSGIELLLAPHKDIQITASFTSGKEALDYYKSHYVDIVITDLDMPEKSGITLIKNIRSLNPNQKVIVLSMIDQDSIIRRMLKYNVNGYLMKNEAQAELVTAIRKVQTGETYYNKEIRTFLFQKGNHNPQPTSKSIPHLSIREKEVLQLIIQELTTKEIAQKLFISEGTVITHRKHILIKLDVKNTAGMVRKALELGLV